MPQFFFNIPAAGIFDQEGSELASLATMLDEANASAREILAEAVLMGDEERQHWVLEVADQGGRTVLALRLGEAPSAPMGDNRGSPAGEPSSAHKYCCTPLGPGSLSRASEEAGDCAWLWIR
jgi:hypothetical protein